MIKTICLLLLSTSLLWTAEIEKGIAAQYTRDKGIERDPTVIFATSFEEGIKQPLKITRKGVLALTDEISSHSGKGCAQITATKDVDEGGDLKIHWQKGLNL